MSSQEPPFFTAIRKGDVEEVRAQLPLQDINAKVNGFVTPLVHACFYNREEIARILLRSGAVLDNDDPDGPLLIAAELGKQSIVEMLLSHGADVNQQGREGTPLYLAANRQKTEVVRILTNTEGILIDKASYNGQTPLHAVAMNGCVDTARILIDNKANVESITPSGTTPLYWSVTFGHIGVTKLLLESHADPNRANEQGAGWSPLGLACWKGFTEISQLLLEQGADPNFKNKRGQSPLILAVNFGFEEIVKSLLNHGARVDTDSFSIDTGVSEGTKRRIIDLLQKERQKQSNSVAQIVDLTKLNPNHLSNRSFTATFRSIATQGVDSLQEETFRFVVQIDTLSVDAITFILEAGYNDSICRMITKIATKEKKEIKHLFLNVGLSGDVNIEENDTLRDIVERYNIQKDAILLENAMTIYAFSSRTFVVGLQSPDVVQTSPINHQKKGISKNNQGLGEVLHQEVIAILDALSTEAKNTGRAIHMISSSLFAQDNAPSIVQSTEKFTKILCDAMKNLPFGQPHISPQMGDEIVIYYTGHGDPETGGWRLQGKAQILGINPESYTFKSIFDLILQTGPEIPITIISDCCHSGRWVEFLNEIKSVSGEARQPILRVIATCEASQTAGTLVFSSFLKHLMKKGEFKDDILEGQIVTCSDMNFVPSSILQKLIDFVE